MSKFCQSCGMKSQPMLQFCVKCGAEAFGPAPPSLHYQPPQSTTTAPPGRQPQYPLPRGRSVVAGLIHPKERVYRAMMLGFGVVGWILILLGIGWAVTMGEQGAGGIALNFALYGFFALLIFLIFVAVYRANAFGNMILLGPRQFPQLHDMVVNGANELGMRGAPQAFIYNSNGVFNAFACRLLGGPYVFLSSALVEANRDEQVKFVIGHELGHHAAGHLNPWLKLLEMPAYLLPFLRRALSRSQELTCDAIGSYLSKDPVAAETALQMLGCGCGRLNQQMNCDAFLAQEEMVPPIFGFLNEIFSSHPRLTLRMAALKKLPRHP